MRISWDSHELSTLVRKMRFSPVKKLMRKSQENVSFSWESHENLTRFLWAFSSHEKNKILMSKKPRERFSWELENSHENVIFSWESHEILMRIQKLMRILVRDPRALSQVRPQQRGVAVVVFLCFCERSVLSQSCLACTTVSHFYPHSVLLRFRHRLSPWDHGKERWRWRSLPQFCCAFASVLLCQSRLSCTSVSLSSLCPIHTLFSHHSWIFYMWDHGKELWRSLSFCCALRGLSSIVHSASFGIAPRLYVPLVLSLCASHCVALVRTSVSLWHSRYRSWYVVFPNMTALARNAKHDVAIRGRKVPRQGMAGRPHGWERLISSRRSWTSDRSRRAGTSSLLVTRSSTISTPWRTTSSQRRDLQSRTSLTYR